MHSDMLTKALELADRLTHVFVATANTDGVPHVAAAGGLERTPDGRIAVSYWFCPETIANVDANPRISLVVWDPQSDEGYQLLGVSEHPRDMGMLDGYSPDAEQQEHIPQVERQLIVKVERIIGFSHRPHSDVEE